MNQVSKEQFVNGAFWKIIESVSSKGISVVVSIILARILMPQDYGVVALTAIFLNLSDILIDGGFSTTLIRKKTVDDCDYSCILITSLLIGFVLYAVFFIVAPYVASYYKEPLFSPVLRVLGLTLFIQAISVPRNVIVNREMKFRLLCSCNIIGTVISGIIGIAAAYSGFGVWAIVIQRLVQNTLITILLYIRAHFRFKWSFSFDRLKTIISFSTGVVGASLMYFITNNLYNAVIGKKYSVTDLGYYGKGSQLPEQVSLYTFSAISGVLLPTISSYQSDIERVKHIIRKVTSVTAYIIFPMMCVMGLTSKELIVLLLTDKWLPAANLMVGWCVYYMAMPFTLLYSQVYYALGYSYKKIKIESIRLVLMSIGLVVFCFGLNCRIEHLSLIGGLIMLITAIISAGEAGAILSYSISEILSDIGKPTVATLAVGVIVFFLGETFISIESNGAFLSLVVKVLVSCSLYFLISLVWKVDGFMDLAVIAKGMLHRGKKG